MTGDVYMESGTKAKDFDAERHLEDANSDVYTMDLLHDKKVYTTT